MFLYAACHACRKSSPFISAQSSTQPSRCWCGNLYPGWMSCCRSRTSHRCHVISWSSNHISILCPFLSEQLGKASLIMSYCGHWNPFYYNDVFSLHLFLNIFVRIYHTYIWYYGVKYNVNKRLHSCDCYIIKLYFIILAIFFSSWYLLTIWNVQFDPSNQF